MSSHCSWAIQALLAIVLLGKGIWGQEVKAQILTWANWELHPDFSNLQQYSEEGKSPWAYGGTILKNYVKGSISSKWSYFSSLQSLQVPCAASGSWSQVLLMCSLSGIQRGRSCTPFHTHHFIRVQLWIIRYVCEEERVTITPSHLENKHWNSGLHLLCNHFCFAKQI